MLGMQKEHRPDRCRLRGVPAGFGQTMGRRSSSKPHEAASCQAVSGKEATKGEAWFHHQLCSGFWGFWAEGGGFRVRFHEALRVLDILEGSWVREVKYTRMCPK